MQVDENISAKRNMMFHFEFKRVHVDIIELIIHDWRNVEICAHLDFSEERSVTRHLSTIYKKTGFNGKAQLGYLAANYGFKILDKYSKK